MNDKVIDRSQLPFGAKGGDRDMFFYGVEAFTLTDANPTTTNNIQIDGDADFYMVAMTYQVDIAGALQTDATRIVPLITVLINDTGSQKNMSNRPVPLPSIAGTGNEPYRIIRPRIFARNSTIQFNWSRYAVAGTNYHVEFTLHGYKVKG